jgi:hypothetical protein
VCWLSCHNRAFGAWAACVKGGLTRSTPGRLKRIHPRRSGNLRWRLGKPFESLQEWTDERIER